MSKALYSDKFGMALSYAANLHSSQARKGSKKVPYIAHLLGVTSKVLEYGGNETEAIAAVLHDSIEDRPAGGATEKYIKWAFGDEIYELVLELTHKPYDNTKTPEWHVDEYAAHMEHMSDSALLIAICDKQYNIASIIEECSNSNTTVKYRGGWEGVAYKYNTISAKALEVTPAEWNRLTVPVSDLILITSQLIRCLVGKLS